MNKKIRNSLLIIVFILLVMTIGVAFAYFTTIVNGNGNSKIEANVSGNASLKFIKGNPINIVADLSNFKEGKGNLSGISTTQVILSSESIASESYDIYFNIEENEFVYTTDENKPELILTITKPDGKELKEVEGLEYITDNNINGFDVTTKEGLITVFKDYVIETKDETTQEWTFKLYLINLDSNQNDNSGKTFKSNADTTWETNKYYDSNSETEYLCVSSTRLNDRILCNNGGKNLINGKVVPDFATVAVDDEGMFATKDNYGTSYYFRGATEDNYVSFNNMLWRIVRIDGNGNVKMMFYNSDINATVYQSRGVGISAFNGGANYSKGYVKDFLNTWYETNMIDADDYLVKGTYCVDMEKSRPNSNTYYGAHIRLDDNKTPSLLCDTSIEGIDEYKYDSALISADEVAFAGGVYSTPNTSYYLYADQYYWTLSSSYHNYGFITAADLSFYVRDDGRIYSLKVGNGTAIFPTVLLKSSSQYLSGDGTRSNPYTIVTK